MTDSFPTLLVSRRPRQAGVDWSGTTSWLGGAPRLGATPWPRDDGGEPLHFVAQIDLADVAGAANGTPLPTEGSLAFFIGREGAVIHVPGGQGTMPAEPPADTPDLAKFGGARDWHRDLDGRPLFPYWPVRISALDLAPIPDRVDAYRAAQVRAVEKYHPRRECYLSPEQAFAGPAIPDWWQIAIHYAAWLDRALREVPNLIQREQGSLDYALKKVEEAQSKGPAEVQKARNVLDLYQNKIATIHRLTPLLRDFAAEMSAFCSGREPWALMSADELEQLASRWARNAEFAAIHFNHGTFDLDYLRKQMFKALPAAGTAEYAALPASVRELIDRKRAPRPVWWHSALAFAKGLTEAVRLGPPRASKFDRERLETDRQLLASLRPSGTFAGLRRLVNSRAQEVGVVEARIAANEARLAGRLPAENAFSAFAAETAAWVAGRDPWTEMTAADVTCLKDALARADEEFGDFARFIVPARLPDLESSTLRAMATGPDRAYAALPEEVRDLINRDYLLPPELWHQMFGWGVEIQGDSCAMREEGNIMLLQLTYDDLMGWSFGDNGVYQFWIGPDDLLSRNWSAVKMTVECH